MSVCLSMGQLDYYRAVIHSETTCITRTEKSTCSPWFAPSNGGFGRHTNMREKLPSSQEPRCFTWNLKTQWFCRWFIDIHNICTTLQFPKSESSCTSLSVTGTCQSGNTRSSFSAIIIRKSKYSSCFWSSKNLGVILQGN